MERGKAYKVAPRSTTGCPKRVKSIAVGYRDRREAVRFPSITTQRAADKGGSAKWFAVSRLAADSPYLVDYHRQDLSGHPLDQVIGDLVLRQGRSVGVYLDYGDACPPPRYSW